MQLLMADRPTYYVSLGDSMSIDAYAGGPGRGAASLLFKNRNEVFPGWQGRDLSTTMPGVRLIPLAMDGATSATVRLVQLPRLREMNIKAGVATVTMGGNDLLQVLGDDAAAEKAITAFRMNADAALTELRRFLLPDAPLMVGTVYDPSDGTGDTERLELGIWDGLKWVKAINAEIRTLAKKHGAVVADIHAAFHGHGLSVGDPTQDEAEPENRELYYCGTIEPNAWGASVLRQTFWEALKNSPSPSSPRLTTLESGTR